jgi:hypothetical protein
MLAARSTAVTIVNNMASMEEGGKLVLGFEQIFNFCLSKKLTFVTADDRTSDS